MPKILYLDMDNVFVDFASGIARLSEETKRAFEGRLDEVPDIFGKMDPMPYAIELFHELSQRFDSYLSSTAPWENPSAWTDKLLWVKRHLGQAARKRLILTHHKNLNVGRFYVDDRTKNGADRFVGEHIHFGTQRFRDWPTVVEYLMARAT